MLSNLNDMQRSAVTAPLDRPLLVLSGAGTGKTRVITTRIAYIINNEFSSPSEIMAVTFTNRAANEMKYRIHNMVNNTADMWIGTFHSICTRILRQHASLIGFTNNFTIVDEDDQVKLGKQILTNIGKDKKLAADLIDKLSWLKSKLIDLTAVNHAHKITREDVDFFRLYHTQLKVYNSLDFDDLLLKTIDLFQENPQVLEQYRNRFKHILVDEYQDTNLAQYMLLRLLSPHGEGLCCVGDDDQSVYSWRGAEIKNILQFERDFPNTTVIKLEQNYRSTGNILKVANSLISYNRNRHCKNLWTLHGDGEKVMVLGFQTGFDEAKYVSKQILGTLNRYGVKHKETAILVRAGYQTRQFEEIFVQLNIPYRVIGGPKFYDRQEIKDILAYMRIVNQEEDGLAFSRAINRPKRGIGEVFVKKLHDIANVNKCSLFKAGEIFLSTKPTTRKSTVSELEQFLSQVKEWRDKHMSPSELARSIVKDTEYKKFLLQDKLADAKMENLEELFIALEQYDDLHTFLEHVSLVSDNNKINDEDLVTLMTLHSSKGLEFEAVFLCGIEDGMLPHARSIKEGNLEEERRLAYVGMTRARKMLFLTFAYNRRTFNQWTQSGPSQFILELPKENIIEFNVLK